ncbi:hypothetical protein HYE67_000015 [Fusarium culmorum]|uniref:RING-type domain-containing protein n=1 Tax=Fusarium culmorum TaxID=5516 RepID=A0A2T4GF06_FUSCU|nr:hypothetical protein FCULG_00012942 [Fusarium culmorum]QPC57784.1 hypothetical protein HYE67_000015 [Fusarium culmorum]
MFLPANPIARAAKEEGYVPHKPPSMAIVLTILGAMILILTPFWYGKIALIRRCFHTNATPPPRRTNLCLAPEALKLMPVTKYQSCLQEIRQLGENNRITPHDICQKCSICTDDFLNGVRIRSLPCGHLFHPKCIDPWLLERAVTCPMCRVDTLTHILMSPKMPSRPRRVFGDLPALSTVLTIQSGGPGTAIPPRPFHHYQTHVPTVTEISERAGAV